jgi:cytochrome c553
MRLRTAWLGASVAVFGGGVGAFGGCSTTSTAVGGFDGGSSEDAGSDAQPIDAGASPDGSSDASDAGSDAPPVVTGTAIVSARGAPLVAAPGDALPLKVVFTLSDGTTQDLPAGTTVTWTSPATVTAQNPDDPMMDDAGDPISVLPDAGAAPTAFYVANPFRTDRSDYPGLLFVIGAGTTADAGVLVSARLADGGALSAVVSIASAPLVGNADAGGYLYQTVTPCGGCHGPNGQGSTAIVLADGGVEYNLPSGPSPFPAPGLNDAFPDGGDPSVAADPAWSAALLGMAAQGDLDNNGVALRSPMPNWTGTPNAQGKPLSAQDFADLYAWLKAQQETQ